MDRRKKDIGLSALREIKAMGKHNCNDQISIYDISEDAMEMPRDVYVWIDDSNDLELPIAICDSAEELSELTNFSVSYINDLIAKAEKRGGKSKFMKVRI